MNWLKRLLRRPARGGFVPPGPPVLVGEHVCRYPFPEAPTVWRPAPGDIAVLRTPLALSPDQRQQLKADWERFTRTRAVVLERGLELQLVIRETFADGGGI